MPVPPLRYKRKGSSTLGLDFLRQGVSWEESETKKKKKKANSGNQDERYFSVATRKLLRSEAPVSVISVTPESSDVINSSSFLPLGDAEQESMGQSGNGLMMLTLAADPTEVFIVI